MSNERFFVIVCYDVADDNLNIKICYVIGYEWMSSFFCVPWLYHLIPRNIELTAECNPTFCKSHNDGSLPFSAIFAIFAGFEGTKRSHGPADNPMT